MFKFIWLFSSLLFLGCNHSPPIFENNRKLSTPPLTKPHTSYSIEKNEYLGFNSPQAINKIADIENEYFENYESGLSNYYGTIWRKNALQSFIRNDSVNLFKRYREVKNSPDSMHCTIYAMKALKAGFGDDFHQLDSLHKEEWKEREYAGWSIGYLLVTHFNWKAYLVISKSSEEYDRCIKNFQHDQKYHVWRQPDIPLEHVYDFDSESNSIDSLLSCHEFGWGFSYQGWHTWITRFKELKDCNWAGAPTKNYEIFGEQPLFLSRNLTDYYDYSSHIIIFPPRNQSNHTLSKQNL